uniref:Polyamine oxidase 5 n=1 Tax=Cajanus cajan TaxID=3821 RepID=A0A151SWZ5_CAJCA|nr:putative polyamine oxidase 5 [Cajanus cajan]
MAVKKPRIVIIGAGMAGLTAANKLYTATASKDLFELCVVEGGSRIGGRINTSEFGGDRIEMGATWIHGIVGSPIHKIAQEIHSLHSHQPWECMDGNTDDAITIAEGGFHLNPSIVDPITKLFNNLMDYCQGKLTRATAKGCGNWSRKLLEEGIFAMHENNQRTYTSADDLFTLDYGAESEYRMFPVMSADHVIVTVSLGVLKAAIGDDDSGMFCPPLPPSKTEAISRLGFGVVNKLFMQLSPTHGVDKNEHEQSNKGFPFLQMVFHSPQSEMKHKKIPWWMRKTATLFPIYNNSSVLLSWFVGEEALALESLKDEEIINGVSSTVSCFLQHSQWQKGSSSHKFKVLKSKWGTDPLFLGSYSYVAVGSSGDDLDTMAEPLPKDSSCQPSASSPLQILFAGEATHRTHYSTTHGAYFSGLREANRLLQHYHCVGIYNN